MLSGEATNTNFLVFGLTRLGLEPTIYRTRGKHANHYTTDVVLCKGQKGYTVMVDDKEWDNMFFELLSFCQIF